MSVFEYTLLKQIKVELRKSQTGPATHGYKNCSININVQVSRKHRENNVTFVRTKGP